ncbi:SDR family oxidoreductase [Mycolicibacillus parakoreensis]|uniref:SDR family oxidoreductase n=1 Tax=Mycolicibacillus parakoreensis TaxID=1069221 RepID=A0ABY3U717_9MYCO|nr:SDR family oxidoreductase [Mycolicibacillus parakoreensis]MCV7314344.1 SDR family oxidoreductase [Mycolicibacillus parakoreensis]ULN53307.1 SDR family oxidoreductase [Mycolicibacillus parakoreensis]
MTLSRHAASLDGKVAVVTGGGSGIGRGIAETFAEYGARVVIWEKDAQTAQTVTSSVGGLACVIDVRDPEQVDGALSRTVEEVGIPTVLVNNAGGVFKSPLLDTSINGWDSLIRSNLTHVLLCTQRVARIIVQHQAVGSIINIATIEGTRAAPGYAAYAAAKAGVINFTKTAALELAPHRIRVNCLAPDFTLTEGLERIGTPESLANAANNVPAARAGHVHEMGGAALFLATELGAYVTGQTIHVDGGTSAAGGWYHHPVTGEYILGAPQPGAGT